MNNFLYNKIIASVSKVIKKSINEAYDTSIYDNMYTSFDKLSILNSAGKIGDILQINQYGEYQVKPGNLVNESIFDDIDFDDDDVTVFDKLNKWKDFAICFGEGLWVYLDWIGLNKGLSWAQIGTNLWQAKIPNKNGYDKTQYILNKYKKSIKGTIWEEVQNCKYPIYIPTKKQLERIYKINEKYKLMSLSTSDFWSSSQCVRSDQDYKDAFSVDFSYGDVYLNSKTNEYLSVALLHF